MHVRLRIIILLLVLSLQLACDASRSEGYIELHLFNLDGENIESVSISITNSNSEYNEIVSREAISGDQVAFPSFKTGLYKVSANGLSGGGERLQSGVSAQFELKQGQVSDVYVVLMDIRHEQCEEGIKLCDGVSGWDVVMTCADGQVWEAAETCPPLQHCDEATCIDGAPIASDGDEDINSSDGDLETDDDDDMEQEKDLVEGGTWCGQTQSVTCLEGYPCLPVIPTGQTLCYGTDMGIINCPGIAGSEDCSSTNLCGQDAQYPSPERDYEIRQSENDSYVCDRFTTLIWQQSFAENLSWDEARSYCGNLVYAGESDWRLPSISELKSIVDYSSNSPALKGDVFPGVVEGKLLFWSSTPLSINAQKGLIVRFSSGVVSIENLIDQYNVRCVRGGPDVEIVDAIYESATPTAGEQVITDSGTQLMWQAVAIGSKSWAQALSYCEGLTFAGFTDWRLPDINELATLVDLNEYRPASSFPSMPPNWFWSSTSIASDATFAWIVNFKDYGEPTSVYKSAQAHTRCVRGPGELQCNNETCLDPVTGIEWERVSGSVMEHMAAEAYCENLILNGFGDWHLPSIGELRSLVRGCPRTEKEGGCYVDDGCTFADCQDQTCKGCDVGEGPSVDGCYIDSGFIGSCNWYWSSTDYGNSPQSQAWFLDFYGALIGNTGKTDENYVRCARIRHR